MTTTVVSIAGRRVLEVLRDLGYRTVVLDHEVPWEVALNADVPVEVDLDDWEAAEAALTRVHQRAPVDAVLSVRDSYVPLAGYLAARLGVRGLALHAAQICHDKSRMRRALDGAGVANPRYAVVEEPAAALPAAGAVGYPMVVKRVRGAGGAGVRLCRDDAELAAVVVELTEPDDPVPLLLEEYLDGVEYAVQTVTVDGVTEVLSVLAEHIGPPPRFAETGYDVPSGLAVADEALLGRYVADALAAIGFDHGIAHAQVRLTADGPRVIEINPRPPGGVITDVTEVVSGVDLVRAAVQATLGVPLTRSAPRASHARYRCVVFPHAGVVHYDVSALEDLPPAPPGVPAPIVSIDVEPGDVVLPVEHPDGGVYGRVVVFGATEAELDAQYDAILGRLAIRVRPIPDGIRRSP